jgi:hypothetical protein
MLVEPDCPAYTCSSLVTSPTEDNIVQLDLGKRKPKKVGSVQRTVQKTKETLIVKLSKQ